MHLIQASTLPTIMKLLPVLIQVFFLTLLSKNATSSCPSRDQFSDCEDPDNYLQTYGQISCTKFNMADGLQAQWKFINSEDIGVCLQQVIIICILSYKWDINRMLINNRL